MEFAASIKLLEAEIGRYLRNVAVEFYLDNKITDWAPKLPMQSPNKCHNYPENFRDYLEYQLLPARHYFPAEFNFKMICQDLVEEAANKLIESITSAPKINTAGIIDLYQDYVFLLAYVRGKGSTDKQANDDSAMRDSQKEEEKEKQSEITDEFEKKLINLKNVCDFFIFSSVDLETVNQQAPVAFNAIYDICKKFKEERLKV